MVYSTDVINKKLMFDAYLLIIANILYKKRQHIYPIYSPNQVHLWQIFNLQVVHFLFQCSMEQYE